MYRGIRVWPGYSFVKTYGITKVELGVKYHNHGLLFYSKFVGGDYHGEYSGLTPTAAIRPLLNHIGMWGGRSGVEEFKLRILEKEFA